MADAMPKTCFLICPIGDPASKERVWSDDITNNFVIPLAREFGYSARRAIDGSRPGDITSTMIADIIESDLVVADLTFNNANVFYELAVRHAQGKAFILIAAVGTKIPFDIVTMNTVWIDISTFGSSDTSRQELRRHFQAVADGTASFDNPIKRHQEKLKADQSGDPIEKRILQLEEQLATVARGLMPRPDPVSIRAAARRAPNPSIFEKVEGKAFGLFIDDIDQGIIFLASNNEIIASGDDMPFSRWRVDGSELVLEGSSGEVLGRFLVTLRGEFVQVKDPGLSLHKALLLRPIS